MTTAQRDAGPRASAMQGLFEGFRAELDDYNDRRERLIKASRDVTTASKRLIFLLHRFPHAAFHAIREGNGAVAPASLSAARRLLADGYAKRAEIVAVIVHAAQSEGLAGVASEPSRGARYDRAFGGGLEEFIEAVTFLHYLEHGVIMPIEDVQALLVDAKGDVVLSLSPQRYLLGLSDLCGELMRFATNAIGAGDTGEIVLPVLDTLRQLAIHLDPFVPLIRDFRRKQQVTAQSMRKIEDISYTIKVRSAEFGSDPVAVREMLRRALAGGAGPGGSGGGGGGGNDDDQDDV